MTHIFQYRVKGEDHQRHFYIDTLPETCHGEPSVEEQIIDELQREDYYYSDHGCPETPVRTYELEYCREFTRSRSVGVTILRVVEMNRGYGGPEEGSWYYDIEHLVREFTVPTRTGYYQPAPVIQCYWATRPTRATGDTV